MSATRTRSRNGSAPAEPVEPAASEPVEPAPVLDIIGAAEREQVSKSARVYVDVCSRQLTPSGALTCVQREKRADGTLGEFLLASINVSKGQDGKPRENVRHTPIAHLQECKDALGSAGVVILRNPLGVKLD